MPLEENPSEAEIARSTAQLGRGDVHAFWIPAFGTGEPGVRDVCTASAIRMQVLLVHRSTEYSRRDGFMLRAFVWQLTSMWVGGPNSQHFSFFSLVLLCCLHFRPEATVQARIASSEKLGKIHGARSNGASCEARHWPEDGG